MKVPQANQACGAFFYPFQKIRLRRTTQTGPLHLERACPPRPLRLRQTLPNDVQTRPSIRVDTADGIRSVELYSAASTRVLAAEYADGLRTTLPASGQGQVRPCPEARSGERPDTRKKHRKDRQERECTSLKTINHLFFNTITQSVCTSKNHHQLMESH